MIPITFSLPKANKPLEPLEEFRYKGQSKNGAFDLIFVVMKHRLQALIRLLRHCQQSNIRKFDLFLLLTEYYGNQLKAQGKNYA